MINLGNYKKESLTDLEVSVKDSVKIDEIKKGEKTSILLDTMFKTVFLSEFRLKYSAKFLFYYLDISYEELLKNIKLSKNEHDKKSSC